MTHTHEPVESDAPRPVRQEQQDANPEVTEESPGVLRMQLPIDLPGLGHVNCYALEDRDGVTLVDPGLASDDSWTCLVDRLSQAGYTPAQVHTVFVTHSHFDHFGGGYRLQEEFGARVITHEDFSAVPPGREEMLRGDLDLEAAVELTRKRFDEPLPWGAKRIVPDDREAFFEMVASRREQWMSVPTTTDPLVDDDVVRLADREWVALFTPGHTDDHLCLLDPDSGVMLSGDHVLPTITPHISGMGNPDALQDFFGSLERVGAIAGVTKVLPAHGHPFDDLDLRTREIREHHEERLDKVRDNATAEPWATVEAHMRGLFSERAWGDMAQSEAFAHLEHLRAGGDMTHRINGNGEFEYHLAN